MIVDAVLIGLYVALTSLPAQAVVLDQISWELALFMAIAAGAPQSVRHLLKERGIDPDLDSDDSPPN